MRGSILKLKVDGGAEGNRTPVLRNSLVIELQVSGRISYDTPSTTAVSSDRGTVAPHYQEEHCFPAVGVRPSPARIGWRTGGAG